MFLHVLVEEVLKERTGCCQDHLVSLYLLTILASKGHIGELFVLSQVSKCWVDILLKIVPLQTKLFRHDEPSVCWNFQATCDCDIGLVTKIRVKTGDLGFGFIESGSDQTQSLFFLSGICLKSRLEYLECSRSLWCICSSQLSSFQLSECPNSSLCVHNILSSFDWT